MKRNLFIIFIAIFSLIVLCSCESISMSDRLVGHWETEAVPHQAHFSAKQEMYARAYEFYQDGTFEEFVIIDGKISDDYECDYGNWSVIDDAHIKTTNIWGSMDTITFKLSGNKLVIDDREYIKGDFFE